METLNIDATLIQAAPRLTAADGTGLTGTELTDLGAPCLHELFETQADLRPANPALVWGPQVLTYAELEAQANRLARTLRARGAGPSRFVGVFFERSAHPIVAILACLKSGAAYVPIDPSFPNERIRHILDECSAALVMTESSLAGRAREILGASAERMMVELEADAARIAAASPARLTREETGLSPDDAAYVIYTSGTTGRPKGVVALHGGAALYVDAFNKVCGTSTTDRVYQGFALTFDGSVEEIWMAFSNGSALVTPTKLTPKFGNELGETLAAAGVTYFSTVPTLLSTITDPVPSLKTVVVSGEVCPDELVTRWSPRPGLKLFNVYGPTEATVNSTALLCVAGKPVTIGQPLPGYGIHILNEALDAVAHGEKGELFVSGPTLAAGYLKQPELTAEKFIVQGGLRLYRTGDLVRWNAAGELEFFGRIDGQVKIRGYRVELAEIESVLLENANIGAAAVRLIEHNGLQELAAYVTLKNPQAGLDRSVVLAALEKRVPPYMIPGFLDILAELPRLTSGKIDRKTLPAAATPLLRAARQVVLPASELEERIAKTWAEVLGLPAVSVTDDFFTDLGGHSLVAAKMATLLRKVVNRPMTVREAYAFPTVRGLAEHLAGVPEAGAPGSAESKADDLDADLTPSARSVYESLPQAVRLATTALQAVSLYVLYGLGSIPFGILFLIGRDWVYGNATLARLIVSSVLVLLAAWPALLAIAIASKWLVIGRYKAGRYPLSSFYYFRWWLAGRFQAFSGAGLLVGTPLLPIYLRLMGAKIGRGVMLDTASLGTYDLLEIGDETSIGADTQIPGSRIEGGLLHVGSATIGKRCFIGLHSALGLGTAMADDARLGDQSLLPDNESIASGCAMRGSPAQPGDVVLPASETAPAANALLAASPVVFGLLQLLASELVGIGSLLPTVPFLILYYRAFADYGVMFGAGALIASVPVGVIVGCLWIAFLKKTILPRVEPGAYPVASLLYLRKWLSDGIMKASRALMLPVYTTMFLPSWLRLMGAKIGARAELSTVWAFSPELIEVGEESFFADGSIVGGKRLYRGVFEIAVNKIGRRSFVGNSAILPVGQSLGDNGLLGVQSCPPASPTNCTPDGTEWLGSPSFALPNRPKIGSFDPSTTYKPTRKLYAQRAVVDTCRILIPGYLGLASVVAGVLAMNAVFVSRGMAAMFLATPVIGFTLALAAALAVVALKWAVMGTFKPVIVPLWSMYVWLNEMVNGAYESVMTPALAPLLGTPFITPFLRAIGCKIGKRTHIESMLFSEWDLVEIGDYACLNAGAIIQSHLFEDRVMKSSTLKIGEGCSVGNMAVVLYDAEMQEGSRLAPLSLLMKGEKLEPRTAWHGIPTTRVHQSVCKRPSAAAAPTSPKFGIQTSFFRRRFIGRRFVSSHSHVAKEALG